MSAKNPKPSIHHAEGWLYDLFAAMDQPGHDVHPVVSIFGGSTGPSSRGSCDTRRREVGVQSWPQTSSGTLQNHTGHCTDITGKLI